jgi:hypothetical protein
MSNLNADFLLDIWADIKAKRLAPVAIGLGVALVAMPALMLKGEEAPSSSPLPIVAAPASADGAEVELAEELGDSESRLDSYKARDPFDGLVKPGEDDGPSTNGTAIAPSDIIGDALDKGASSAPSTGSSSEGSDPPLDLGGSTDTGGSDGGLTTPDDQPTIVKRPRTGYTYQLDVKFGRPGREKRYRNLTRMSVLPSKKVPALLFMGVPEDAKSAIFFVHPAFSHAGEGICMPSNAQCNFLELKIGRDHFLSVNDYEFRIHLLGINKVKIKDDDGAGVRKTTGTRRSARSVGDGAETDESGLPELVDGLG